MTWKMLILAAAWVSAAMVTGPTLHNLSNDGVTVIYGTDSAVRDTIRFGPDSALPSFTLVDDSVVTRHTFRLSGVPRDTLCHYAVISSGSRVNGCFRTPPLPGSPLTFVIFSDFHLDAWYAAAFFPRFAEDSALFAVSNGDITNSGRYTDEWTNWISRWTPFGRNLPLFNTPGNHDQYELSGWSSDSTGMGRANYHRFNDPQAGYYSATMGAVHLVSLNAFGDTAVQRAFLEADLAAADADSAVIWKFVSLHVPLFSWSGYQLNWGLIAAYQSIFKAHGVDAVFSGHSHTYQHIKRISKPSFWAPIQYDLLAPVYLVGGRGGSAVGGIAALGPDSFIVAESSDRHFIRVEAGAESAVFTAINDTGRVIDSFTIEKAGPVTGISVRTAKNALCLTVAPNPFNPTVRFRISMPGDERGVLRIYDCAGRLSVDLSVEIKKDRIVEWNAGSRASGLYFAVLECGPKRLMKAIFLIR